MSVHGSEAHRRNRRLKIFTPALLMRGAETHRIHLLDISRGGALAYADVPPHRSDRVRVQCEALYASAVVAWVDGKRFGLMFSVPVDERVLRAIVDSELPPASAIAARVNRPRVHG